MERPVSIGDYVVVHVENSAYYYIIKGIYPLPEIAAVSYTGPIDEIVIKPIQDQWRVFKLGKDSTQIPVEYPYHIRFIQGVVSAPDDYYRNIILTEKYINRSPLGGMTKEQILASGLIGLFHSTKLHSLKGIFELGRIDTGVSLGRENIPTIKGFEIGGTEEPTVVTSTYNQRWFPGIYTTPISVAAILNKQYYIPRGEYFTLVLSLAPLQQQNWHMNTAHSYGVIDNITFSPQTLSERLHELPSLWMNRLKKYYNIPELVFHDALPISLIEAILVTTEAQKQQAEEVVQGRIPVLVITPELERDLSQRRFVKGMDDLSLLSSNIPQYCNTVSSIANKKVIQFSLENPYKLDASINDLPSEIKDREDAYIWEKRLKLCGINRPHNKRDEKELFNLMEEQLQRIYFESLPRIPISNDDLPPWKYTPEYYSQHITPFIQ